MVTDDRFYCPTIQDTWGEDTPIQKLVHMLAHKVLSSLGILVPERVSSSGKLVRYRV